MLHSYTPKTPPKKPKKNRFIKITARLKTHKNISVSKNPNAQTPHFLRLFLRS
ncbi:hypothetical protein HPSA20_0113 [Helicobacter pylori SouthAfrica20]|uniref:Uncharacterized protein n=1 Tax=Helicobacter pylori SouthAfrica20 TaxID=1352356 RepID=T1U7L8_HELPX|nr:hypothetical protein HPSA20_0113 [Helicobacter pylori SouthAfrica20]